MHDFGPYRYDPAQRILFRGTEVVPLMPKAIDTLHVLLERRGQVVDKAELMKLVWPDCTVEEIGLARNISLLRKTIGDEYIETVPKRGYRFPVAEAPSAPASAGRRRWPWIAAALIVPALLVYWQFYAPSRYVPRSGSPLLAVVPFECLDAGADEAAFARGFSDSLVAEISRGGSAQVISPSTVDRYRSARIPVAFMTRVLGAQVVVEGKVLRTGDRYRVDARLTDVHSGRLIWADTYEGEAARAEKAAQAIAERLRKVR